MCEVGPPWHLESDLGPTNCTQGASVLFGPEKWTAQRKDGCTLALDRLEARFQCGRVIKGAFTLQVLHRWQGARTITMLLLCYTRFLIATMACWTLRIMAQQTRGRYPVFVGCCMSG